MSPTDYFRSLQATIPEGLERTVYGYLLAHSDQMVTKEELILDAFGMPEQDTKNKPLDRKVRVSIAKLRKDHNVLIYSFQDREGYYLDTIGDIELFELYTRGMESRMNAIADDLFAARLNWAALKSRGWTAADMTEREQPILPLDLCV